MATRRLFATLAVAAFACVLGVGILVGCMTGTTPDCSGDSGCGPGVLPEASAPEAAVPDVAAESATTDAPPPDGPTADGPSTDGSATDATKD